MMNPSFLAERLRKESQALPSAGERIGTGVTVEASVAVVCEPGIFGRHLFTPISAGINVVVVIEAVLIAIAEVVAVDRAIDALNGTTGCDSECEAGKNEFVR
jgi:hypothetical protein